MPAGPRPVYQEFTPWSPWIAVVTWAATAFAAITVLVTDDLEAGLRMPVAVGILAFAALLQWSLAGLRVRLYRDHLKASLGRSRLIRTRIDYDEIVATEVVTYAPLREFGGWGVRFRGNKRAWTARGDEAVVLHLADGKELYLGSDEPGRLRERIVAVAGTRLGRSAEG